VAAPACGFVSQPPESLRDFVRERAGNRCEYCLVPDVFVSVHEPDHIIAAQHRGATTPENLALACFDCNRYKGPNISSVDPATEQVGRFSIRDGTGGPSISTWKVPVL